MWRGSSRARFPAKGTRDADCDVYILRSDRELYALHGIRPVALASLKCA